MPHKIKSLEVVHCFLFPAMTLNINGFALNKSLDAHRENFEVNVSFKFNPLIYAYICMLIYAYIYIFAYVYINILINNDNLCTSNWVKLMNRDFDAVSSSDFLLQEIFINDILAYE